MGNGKDPLLNERLMELLNDPTVKEFITIMNDRGYPQQPQVPREADVDAKLRKIRESHSEAEVKVAMEWVLGGAFGDMIRYDGRGNATLWFANFLANKESRAKGWTNSGDGFIIGRSIDVDKFALFYIDVILDETFRDDEAKIWAIIEYSRDHDEYKMGMMHPGLLWLIGESNELELWIHGDSADKVPGVIQ